MSKIQVDEITPLSGTNTDLIVSGKGTGVPNLSANFKVGGTAGVPLLEAGEHPGKLLRLQVHQLPRHFRRLRVAQPLLYKPSSHQARLLQI